MTNEFMREERYIVFKLSDVERYLTDKDRANITMMKMEIDAGRDCANKPPFKGLIVEADWPEYEPTWKAIEARVAGAQPAPSAEYVGWYCAHCERGVDASEVTYHEQHQVCGRIITDDKPPKPAPSVPELLESLRCACNYIDKLGGVSQQYRALLAAAPEAKP